VLAPDQRAMRSSSISLQQIASGRSNREAQIDTAVENPFVQGARIQGCKGHSKRRGAKVNDLLKAKIATT
jgi:hypothetical protein